MYKSGCVFEFTSSEVYDKHWFDGFVECPECECEINIRKGLKGGGSDA